MSKCDICSKDLPTERGMKVHRARKHKNPVTYEKDCAHCGDTIEYKKYQEVKYCSDKCRRNGIAESVSGKSNPNYRKDRTELMDKMARARNEWRSTLTEKEHDKIKKKMGKGIQEWWNDDTVNHEKRNEKVSKSLKEHWNEIGFKERGNVAFGRGQFVNQLDHYVRSDLEKKILLSIQSKGISYEYEPFTIERNGISYIPDVVIGDVVLEIKGLVKDKDSEIARMMTQNPDYRFFVYGHELECNTYFQFNQLDELIEVLENE